MCSAFVILLFFNRKNICFLHTDWNHSSMEQVWAPPKHCGGVYSDSTRSFFPPQTDHVSVCSRKRGLIKSYNIIFIKFPLTSPNCVGSVTLCVAEMPLGHYLGARRSFKDSTAGESERKKVGGVGSRGRGGRRVRGREKKPVEVWWLERRRTQNVTCDKCGNGTRE